MCETVLVTGATGTVGSAVVRELRARDARVRVLVRRHRPDLDPDVEQVVGDLLDAEVVGRAMSGVAAAFYVSPHADDEVALARTFADVARDRGVRVVFAGVHVSRRTVLGRLRHRLFRLLMPAYRAKLAIGAMLERSCPGATLLVPTTFFENDELFLADIADGRFPTPLRGMNRVAVADIATVAVGALLDPDFAVGTHPVVGPRSWSGEQCAAVWSTALGRPVTYTGDDAGAWRQTAERRLPPGRKGRDFRASFALLGRIRMGTSTRDVDATSRLLGRPPVDYPTYVAGVVEAGRLDGTRTPAVVR